jgi:diguanylate cyclase (GGDEF)-like protein
MVLPHFTLEQAIERAETLRVMLSERIFTAAQTGETFTCTVSIGVAYAAPGSEAPDSLLRKADNVMYRAKSAGRNQVIG